MGPPIFRRRLINGDFVQKRYVGEKEDVKRGVGGIWEK